jgi:murein DD-endopeptidase MepM/ murein hydrolase activator NlpD
VGVVTSPFGRRWGAQHPGLDLGAAKGTPIVAAAGGTVIEAGATSGGYGNLTLVRLPDGTVLAYAHQSAILVTVGQVVVAGEQIGRVGSTGRSTGPHLHFEVRPGGGAPIDPARWLRARGVAA